MLGPFEVRTDDGVLADVPGARLRGLLIALALEPGHVVPKATLVDWIWGEQPPSDAANALQRLVSRLRKALPDGSVEGQTGRLPVDGGTRRRRRRAVRTPRRPGPQRRGSAAGTAAARGPRTVARCGHAGRRSAGQRGVRRGGHPARRAAPDRHGGSVRRGDQPRPRCGAGHGTDRPGGRAPGAGTARRRADACPRRGRSRHRGAARVPAHERGPGRRAGRRPLTGAVRVARRAAAGRVGTAGGEPEDQPARRADQLRRQGRRCRRGPRTRRRASAHHPDRAGRLGEDQAGHGDRAHAARRPAGRGLAGGARGHRRGR